VPNNLVAIDAMIIYIQHQTCSAECCIFHKQRVFGEWSDGEDSDQECCKPNPSSSDAVGGAIGSSNSLSSSSSGQAVLEIYGVEGPSSVAVQSQPPDVSEKDFVGPHVVAGAS
jgi:hypothetical protein